MKIVDKIIPSNLKPTQEATVPEELESKRRFYALVQFAVYIGVLIGTTIYYRTIETVETKFSNIQEKGYQCISEGTATGKKVVNIELNQRQATCSVTYAFRWKDIGTEKTECRKIMDFRTIGDTTNPTLLTYNVAVTRTKASVLVDAPPEYLGADPTNEDGGTYLEYYFQSYGLADDYFSYYEQQFFEANPDFFYEPLDPYAADPYAADPYAADPYAADPRRRLSRHESGMTGEEGMPAVGPRRRARRSKAAKVARRALNQDTSSGARVLVTLDFNTEDLEGIDMKCQQRVSLPQHINALRDFAGISPFLFNIGWDTMLTGQCDKPIEECLDLDPGNDPLQNMVLYVKYWNMPYRDPKTDYYYAGEWFGHTEFFRAPAVFTSWGNPSLFNQGALCDEIEPPAPFTCRRTVRKNWLESFTLGFSIGGTAFAAAAVLFGALFERSLKKAEAQMTKEETRATEA